MLLVYGTCTWAFYSSRCCCCIWLLMRSCACIPLCYYTTDISKFRAIQRDMNIDYMYICTPQGIQSNYEFTKSIFFRLVSLCQRLLPISSFAIDFYFRSHLPNQANMTAKRIYKKEIISFLFAFIGHIRKRHTVWSWHEEQPRRDGKSIEFLDFCHAFIIKMIPFNGTLDEIKWLKQLFASQNVISKFKHFILATKFKKNIYFAVFFLERSNFFSIYVQFFFPFVTFSQFPFFLYHCLNRAPRG